MKKMELSQMENLQGGDCTKTTTKILVTLGATCVAAASLNIFMTAWGLFTIADMMDDCEDW